MVNAPTYGALRQAVYKMLTAESLYRSWKQTEKAEECRQLAVKIMASMSQSDFDNLTRELTEQSRHYSKKRISGYRIARQKLVP